LFDRGSALSLIYEKENRPSRATRDLDVVVLFSAQTPNFIKAMARFAQEGGYQDVHASPNYCSYRFANPKAYGFPKQIELFTKDEKLGFSLKKNIQHLSLDSTVSFSSIVLDPVYFDYIAAHSKKDEVTYIEDYAIVPLKAKAYVENQKLLIAGIPGISEETVRKHARDIIRFVRDFQPKKIDLPPEIKKDCQSFLDEVVKGGFSVEQITGAKNFHLADFVALFTEDYLS
jgi:hypothetical protein